jgi:hypothetical protein
MMKANKKTLMAVKNYLENQNGWDLDEVVERIVSDTKLLKHKDMDEHNLSTDECGITWGDEYICGLNTFIESYSNLFVERICNVLDSFVGEDISCYFDEE